jgi:L-asparaginase
VVNVKMRSVRVVLGTGGTIAGRAADAADNVGYVAGEVGVGDLVEAVPPLRGLPLEWEQVAQIDSKDMGLAVWKYLAERVAHHLARDEVQGVVITHGTDTLEETAWFLQTVLSPQKPVVMTCAMRPASALVPDGPQNLLDAVVVAGCPELSGVVAVAAGSIHSAAHVSKVHSYKVEAFDSGDAGPMGAVEEGEIRWFQPLSEQSGGAAAARLKAVLAAHALPGVALVTSHADADGRVVLGLLALNGVEKESRTRGIVVACTGNGTLHADLTDALEQAHVNGVKVVRATRCARGRVVPHAGDHFPDSAGLSPVKARLALSLSLLPNWR